MRGLSTEIKVGFFAVFVMFILLSPTTKQHLNLLSRLAYCVRDPSFLRFLKTLPKSDDLIAKIGEFEKQLEDSSP